MSSRARTIAAATEGLERASRARRPLETSLSRFLWSMRARAVSSRRGRREKASRSERSACALCTYSSPARSEERRVGKECRSRWSPDQEKKKEREVAARAGLDKARQHR